ELGPVGERDQDPVLDVRSELAEGARRLARAAVGLGVGVALAPPEDRRLDGPRLEVVLEEVRREVERLREGRRRRHGCLRARREDTEECSLQPQPRSCTLRARSRSVRAARRSARRSHVPWGMRILLGLAVLSVLVLAGAARASDETELPFNPFADARVGDWSVFESYVEGGGARGPASVCSWTVVAVKGDTVTVEESVAPVGSYAPP